MDAAISDRPAWDEERAQAMVGAKVLVGITRTSAQGHKQEQMFGSIICANETRGFQIARGCVDGIPDMTI